MSRTLSKAASSSSDSMTLLEHLSELRRRLIISVLAFVGGAIVCYLLYNPILIFLEKPYKIACRSETHVSCTLTNLAPLQGFTTRLNVCAYGGIILGLPVILWQLWQFVTPGLKANERRYALPFVIATVTLFFLGGATAYIIYPHGLTWLLAQSGPGVSPAVSIQSYIGLITLLIVIFGIAFEFPAVLVGLELAGVVKPAALRRVRRFAFLGIVIFSAFITPSSDPFSMLALVVPLAAFYEGSILVGRLLGK
ncbi:MAG: twin-arginine translocase subunit TatC [Actinomycetota bacterium]|nr:twin-arginine translocase subunit TatC [Actinomycetota bacterium]